MIMKKIRWWTDIESDMSFLLLGVHLQRNDSSVQPASDSEPPSEAQVYRVILQPSEAIPPIGTKFYYKQLNKLNSSSVVEGITVKMLKEWISDGLKQVWQC